MGKRGRVYNRFFNEKDWEEVNQENKDIMEDYIMELKQKQIKPSTIKQYTSDWKIIFIHILNNFNNKSVLQLNKKDFRRISLYFKEECDLSNARVNRIMSAIRSMLNFCEDDDDYEEYNNNVASKVRGLPKEEVKEIVFLTDEQIFKIKDKLLEMKEYQKATLLMLAYDSAGRKNEIFQVKKHSFLDEEKSSTNIVVGKRGKKFPLIYFDETKKCAKLYLEQRGEDDIDSMWITGQGNTKRTIQIGAIYDWIIIMNDILQAIEDEDFGFNVHSLRHATLENMKNGSHYICKILKREEGFTIDELKFLAHHSDISTTSSYLKNDEGEILSKTFGISMG